MRAGPERRLARDVAPACRRNRGATAGFQRGLALLACALLAAPLVAADSAVLARVGALTLDTARFEARAASVAAAAWAELGGTWAERRRRLLDVLIDDALLASAAERAPALPTARDAALARVLRAELRAELAPPSSAELQAFAAASPAGFGEPHALELYRILLRSDEEARAVLAQLAPPSLVRFGQLARSDSIDAATNMRAGYLGWVAADGQTDVPELRVAPELFERAEAVADGELVGQPVREGDAFAVVWRRASRPARVASAAELTRDATARLQEQRAAEAERTLLERLRRDRLPEHHPELLAGFEPAFAEPARRATRAPAPTPTPPWLTPVATDRGLR